MTCRVQFNNAKLRPPPKFCFVLFETKWSVTALPLLSYSIIGFFHCLVYLQTQTHTRVSGSSMPPHSLLEEDEVRWLSLLWSCWTTTSLRRLAMVSRNTAAKARTPMTNAQLRRPLPSQSMSSIPAVFSSSTPPSKWSASGEVVDGGGGDDDAAVGRRVPLLGSLQCEKVAERMKRRVCLMIGSSLDIMLNRLLADSWAVLSLLLLLTLLLSPSYWSVVIIIDDDEPLGGFMTSSKRKLLVCNMFSSRRSGEIARRSANVARKWSLSNHLESPERSMRSTTSFPAWQRPNLVSSVAKSVVCGNSSLGCSNSTGLVIGVVPGRCLPLEGEMTTPKGDELTWSEGIFVGEGKGEGEVDGMAHGSDVGHMAVARS